MLGALPLAQKRSWGCTALGSLQQLWRTDSEKPGKVEEGRKTTNNLKMERFTILLIFWLWHGKKEKSRALHDAADQPQDIVTCHRIATRCQCF